MKKEEIEAKKSLSKRIGDYCIKIGTFPLKDVEGNYYTCFIHYIGDKTSRHDGIWTRDYYNKIK